MEDLRYIRLTDLRLPCPYSLKPEVLQQVFRKYGFEECSTLLAFIDLFYILHLDRSTLGYILSKAEECLHHHDNGSDYFNELRCLVYTIRTFLNSGKVNAVDSRGVK